MANPRVKRTVRWLQPRLPEAAKRVSADLGKHAGFDHFYPSLPASLRTLSSWGYQPRFAIDIGAYVGLWTTTFRTFFPESAVLMVEPQESKEAHLQTLASATPGVRFASVLLGAENGTTDFYEMEQGSSMLSELTPHPRRVVRKPVVRLDDLLAAAHADLGAPDFLKLDVQGAELQVLAGAPKALAAAEFVLLETAFKPYNDGAPLVGEVLEFMGAHDYFPIDVCGENRSTDGGLLQLDLLFISNASPFVDRWRSIG